MNNQEMLFNYETYKTEADVFKKALKKILKSIPPSLLKEVLVEMRILKQDYLTKECDLREKK